MSVAPAQFSGAGELQEELHRSASLYNRQRGGPPVRGDMSHVVMPHGGTRMIAAHYDRIPQFQAGAQAAASYKALEEEVGRQFDHMTKPVRKGGLGLHPSRSPVDPYGRTDMSQPYANEPNHIVNELQRDVGNNRQIQNLSTDQTGGTQSFGHPDTNDMFRSVHDLYGHAAAGAGIDRHGEEQAYQHHRQMFSPQARGALASELRGQTANLLTTGEFLDYPKHGLGYDSGPLHPQQFGEHMGRLQAENRHEKNLQGLM
jgi:hypothetical protein